MSVSEVAVQVDSPTPESMCNVIHCSRRVFSSGYFIQCIDFAVIEKLYRVSQKSIPV